MGPGTLERVNRKEQQPMEWGIKFLDEMQKMKEEMDRVWNDLFEESPKKREESWQWVEKLPKFEGPGRRSQKSRTYKNIK
jgi:hypothetical protein